MPKAKNLPIARDRPTIEDVGKFVDDYFNVPHLDRAPEEWKKNPHNTLYISVYLIRNLVPQATLTKIAHHFGWKNHVSVFRVLQYFQTFSDRPKPLLLSQAQKCLEAFHASRQVTPDPGPFEAKEDKTPPEPDNKPVAKEYVQAKPKVTAATIDESTRLAETPFVRRHPLLAAAAEQQELRVDVAIALLMQEHGEKAGLSRGTFLKLLASNENRPWATYGKSHLMTYAHLLAAQLGIHPPDAAYEGQPQLVHAQLSPTKPRGV